MTQIVVGANDSERAGEAATLLGGNTATAQPA